MEDKVVLITGSSSGIGRAVALRFAKLGCHLVIHGTDTDRINAVVDECSKLSPKDYKPMGLNYDLRDKANVNRLLDITISYYKKLDVLVNNAGLFQHTTVDKQDAFEIYKDLMNINLDSAVLLTTLAVPHLKKTKGCIVNVSSNLHSKCIEGGFAYCTAKAGLTMFTKAIACDLAPDIRVNSVSPGPVATLMSTRSGVDVETYRSSVGGACLVNRVGEADEIARVIEFLASPESGFITGSDIIVDGGSTIKP